MIRILHTIPVDSNKLSILFGWIRGYGDWTLQHFV